MIPEALTGPGLALLSASCFACSTVFISKSATGRSDQRGVVVSIIFTLGIASLVWLALEGGAPVAANPDGWWTGIVWFALAGLFAMVLGRTLLYRSIRRLGATRASAVKRLNPFFSVLLAFLLLGEAVTAADGGGMLLIAAGFGLLLWQSFAKQGREAEGGAPMAADYLWGVGAALFYAGAYIARKSGLTELAAPAFGTMVSAAAALLFFTVLAGVVPGRRVGFRNLFHGLDRWMVMAGVFISFGQILLFAALFYEKVSTVVMIASLEVFIASWLSVAIFRIEARPNARTVVAAVLVTLGVVAVAAG